MIFSMTGFSTKTIEIPMHNAKAFLTMTLKSLNSRFFEASCKLPQPLQVSEIEFIKMLRDELYRGKVTLTVSISNPLAFKGPIEPSLTIVESYLQALKKIQKKYDIPGTLTLTDIIHLPNIFTEEEHTINETTHALIVKTLKALIEDLRKEQASEGTALARDITNRIAILNKEIKEIEILALNEMEQRKSEVDIKLQALEKSAPDVIELTKYQLFAEIERMDITEEVVRFKSHLANLAEVMASDHTEKGRKIDFILQELTREINTIGSKTTNTTISARAISTKVELEKIREQAQNIV